MNEILMTALASALTTALEALAAAQEGRRSRLPAAIMDDQPEQGQGGNAAHGARRKKILRLEAETHALLTEPAVEVDAAPLAEVEAVVAAEEVEVLPVADAQPALLRFPCPCPQRPSGCCAVRRTGPLYAADRAQGLPGGEWQPQRLPAPWRGVVEHIYALLVLRGLRRQDTPPQPKLGQGRRQALLHHGSAFQTQGQQTGQHFVFGQRPLPTVSGGHRVEASAWTSLQDRQGLQAGRSGPAAARSCRRSRLASGTLSRRAAWAFLVTGLRQGWRLADPK
ncbi:hypothetical protein [Deinococcus sp. QL22]|uniref:hypothetical protein n=1 Tax=Deinococcus sp. QL22 TaxID=2939437 RepID=UPI0020177DC7|nr:hypothetical protein [Deinococcus sp. QL22]UQN08297.1 hypothetical protein M1R55_16315 [Deinococcus sp. QL22]